MVTSETGKRTPVCSGNARVAGIRALQQALCNAHRTVPEYLKKELDQISYMKSIMVRNLRNKLGSLKLEEHRD